eukprot:267267-Prymnesium_polylepis.1
MAFQWWATFPTPASTAPSNRLPRRPSISRCARPSTRPSPNGTATSTTASRRAGGDPTPSAPPTP